MLESLFDKAASLKACNLTKKESNTYFEEHLQTTSSEITAIPPFRDQNVCDRGRFYDGSIYRRKCHFEKIVLWEL